MSINITKIENGLMPGDVYTDGARRTVTVTYVGDSIITTKTDHYNPFTKETETVTDIGWKSSFVYDVAASDNWIRTYRNGHPEFAFRNKGTDRLSRAASMIYKMEVKQGEVWDHLDDYGMGHDCGGMVASYQADEAKAVIELAARIVETTPDGLYEMIAERVGTLFVHNHLTTLENYTMDYSEVMK